jgi:anti-anti-sigma regulatory factor
MGIQNLTKDIIFINLPAKPHVGDELERINQFVSYGCDCDVIIDFSGVEILTSASLSNLMLLDQFLKPLNRQLVLCNVPLPIQCIFIRSGLETFFEFAHNKSAAVEVIRGQDYGESEQI